MAGLNSRGQSALEIAILGSLMMIIVGAILSYGQRLNFQQQIKMEAFRKALERSYAMNAPVSYTLKKDTRFMDPGGGLGQGTSSTASSSASAMWSKGVSGLQEDASHQFDPNAGYGQGLSHSYYQINGDTIKIPMHPKDVLTYTGGNTPTEGWTAMEAYQEDNTKINSYNTTVARRETETNIINERQSNLTETEGIRLHYRYDTYRGNPNAVQLDDNATYVYEGETYVYNGTNLIETGGQYNYTVKMVPVQVDLDDNPGNGNETTVLEPQYVNYTDPNDINTINRRRVWTTEK